MRHVPRPILDTPTAFWSAVDGDPGPGTLVLVLCDSWKRVGDYLGIPSADLLTQMMRGVCDWALPDGPASGQLDMHLYCTYLVGDAARCDPDRALAEWCPFILSNPYTERVNEPWVLTVRTATVPRGAGESGRDLYARAQAAVSSLVSSLPRELQRPALTEPWPLAS